MERIRLLVLQPTKLCNLNCRYCYLPNRRHTDVMLRPVIEGVCRSILTSSHVGSELEISLHGGEPLAAGVAWFKDFIEILVESAPRSLEIKLSVQTNGTLISDAWIQEFKAHSVAVGISLDGPSDLNRGRTNWAGRGTFSRVLKGITKLRDADIPFAVLAVLHRDSILRPDDLFYFFCELKPARVCFNVEEIEGINAHSSLSEPENAALLRHFWRRFWNLSQKFGFPFEVREFQHISEVIFGVLEGGQILNHVAEPVCCVSVATNGDYSTFSPELLEMEHNSLDNFVIGNVLTDTLESALADAKFLALNSAVAAGVDACARSCFYFPFCGGGCPSNKYAETHQLSATETEYCRNAIQTLVDVAIDRVAAPFLPKA